MGNIGAFVAVDRLHGGLAACLKFAQIGPNGSLKKSEVKAALKRTLHRLSVRVLLDFSAHDACHIKVRVELYELLSLKVNRALVLVSVE